MDKAPLCITMSLVPVCSTAPCCYFTRYSAAIERSSCATNRSSSTPAACQSTGKHTSGGGFVVRWNLAERQGGVTDATSRDDNGQMGTGRGVRDCCMLLALVGRQTCKSSRYCRWHEPITGQERVVPNQAWYVSQTETEFTPGVPFPRMR